MSAMRINIEALAISVLLASAAWGQTPSDSAVERVFPFVHLDTPQSFQEVVNAIRSIAEIQRVAVDNATRTVAVNGTADQVKAADFLFHALDLPAGAQPAPVSEFRLAGEARTPIIRVFYMSRNSTPRGLQENINAVRSLMEVQRVVAHNATKAIVLRGDAGQIAGTEWLINLLDRPVGAPPAGSDKLEYRLQDAWSPLAKMHYIANTPSPQAVQDMVNTIRSISELQRVTACNESHVVALRGSDEAIGLADWLIQNLDISAASAPSGKTAKTQVVYKHPGGRPYTISAAVFYLPASSTAQSLQDTVNQLRQVAGIQRSWALPLIKTIAVGGTVDQVAKAELLLQSKDQAAAK